jgi:hypothetical protein
MALTRREEEGIKNERTEARKLEKGPPCRSGVRSVALCLTGREAPGNGQDAPEHPQQTPIGLFPRVALFVQVVFTNPAGPINR